MSPNGAPVVLYVDDEEMALKYFARAFGGEYEVLTAASADAAIDILRAQGSRIGIVVTDYRMPGRDGGDLLRQIEREFPHLIRLLLTAYAEREVLLDAVNSGEIFRILEKPLDMDVLRIALRQASELAHERNLRREKWLAIDETLAFLAHELNTPLAAIRNFSQGVQLRTAQESVSPRQQAEIASAALAIEDNSGYCLTLLDAFVKSVQGAGAQFGAQSATARQLVSSLLDTYPLTASQRAAIDVDIRNDFRIAALPNCVALVLSSLLANALRAVGDSPAAKIRITALVDANPQIRIADNGPGFAPEIMGRMLSDQVTTHAESGGKGWGLIFCRRIMQSFQGGIEIDSIPGSPTTITLNFPAIKAERTDR